MSTAWCAKRESWMSAVFLVIFAIPSTAAYHLIRAPVEAGVQSQQHVPKGKSKTVWEQLIKQKLNEEAKKKDGTEKAQREPGEGAGQEAEGRLEAAEEPVEASTQAPLDWEQPNNVQAEDTSAAEISPEGEDMIKQMVLDESEDDTPRVVKTLEQEEKEWTEEKEALQDPSGKLAEAAKELFDEPADRKYEPHNPDLEQEVFEVGEHNFGHVIWEGDHSLHATLHHAEDKLNQRVHFVLVITPVLVFAAVGYYFGISNIGLPPALDVHNPLMDKMFCHLTGWRRMLGRIIESPIVNFTVLLCIVIDLICASLHDLLMATDLLNPKYNDFKFKVIHTCHNISIYLLMSFLVEQLLHILVFGKMYFYHFWYVMDLCTVYISLVGETVLSEKFGHMVSFIILLRLWKVTNVVFDVFLAGHESEELQEKIRKRRQTLMKSLGS